jgi:hypothetical protein
LTTERIQNAERHAIKECRAHYGFAANPDLPLWKNVPLAITQMPPRLFLERPERGGFHNLCTTLVPPEGTNNLLRLGLKYCIEQGRPNQKIVACIERMKRSVRLKNYLMEQAEFEASQQGDTSVDITYNPKLYVKSKWTPPACERGNTELRMMYFADKLCKIEKSTKHSKRFNLTQYQHTVLKQLKEDQRFFIWQADKNLGPCIIERPRYIARAFSDHLSQADTYTRLTATQAASMIEETSDDLKNILHDHWDNLDLWERDYFKRSFIEDHRTPQFYLTAKVHKKPNWSTRPVVSCVGSFNEIFSKWIDDKMKSLLHLSTTHLKDSNQVLDDLHSLGTLPPGTKIFTADAVSMYTNIHPGHGLDVFTMWFDTFSHEIPRDFPKELFLECLRLVMENNVFQFDNTFWHQKMGTAMGTSAACMYATLYYAFHERTVLMEKYSLNLLYYKRYIDDVLGIWYQHPDSLNTWDDFLSDLNSFGQLKWTADEPSENVIFLDLHISIAPTRNIHTKTYQKEMNLFLYIPPLSAHPAGVLKGLVYGNLRRFWKQNSDINDYIQVAHHFYRKLLERGHNATHLADLFMSAATKFDAESNMSPAQLAETKSTDTADPSDTLFLHLEYHPRGIPRRVIRDLYTETLGPHSGFNRMVVAFSRPKNLRDALMKTQLNEKEGCRASDYIDT